MVWSATFRAIRKTMSERVSRASSMSRGNSNSNNNTTTTNTSPSNRVNNVNKNNDNKSPASYSYTIYGNLTSQAFDEFDLMVLDSSIFG